MATAAPTSMAASSRSSTSIAATWTSTTAGRGPVSCRSRNGEPLPVSTLTLDAWIVRSVSGFGESDLYSDP